ncbi:hypothetical protein [Pedobacter jamesrossensis]|uniref:Outer membrane protein beta-barrel domain-containing protein n=1 Tax=Pedobacter jamesrossensis TaxID=1908238 RepID=A0ABV8NL14_9SPHI
MKNQIRTIAAVIVISALIGFSAKAQSMRSPGVRYSVGADVGLPIGTLSDAYKWSIGGSIQADIPVVSDKLYVTVNAGYTNIFADESVSALIPDIHLIPVKAGLKYFPVDNLYLQGEAGVSFLLNQNTSNSKTASFVYAPQIGYLIPLGGKSSIDAGVRFEGNSKFYDNGSNSNYLGLRIAYAFPLGK